MAETIEQIIRRVAQEVGVDPTLAVAVARQESGLNPRAHNPNGEDSWGLFQGNRSGGMGTGYSPEQLMDPEFNARLMLSAMARTQKATGLTGGALAAASQRPADPQGYARSVNAMLGGSAGTAHAGSPFTPTGTRVAGASTVATTPTKSNTTTAAEKAVEAARKAFEELDERKSRAGLNTPGSIITDEAKAEDAEWRTGTIPEISTSGIQTGTKPSPKVKAWQDAKDALTKAEGALAKSVDDDAKAAGTAAQSGGPSSTTERYLVNPDGTVRKDAQGNPVPNPNYTAPAGSDGNRVVGQSLVGPDGKLIYRDPDTPVRPGISTVDAGNAVVVLQDGKEIGRIAKTEDPSEVDLRRSQARNYDANATATEIANRVKQQQEEAWKPVQALIDAGADPADVRRAISATSTSVNEYATLQGIEAQQNLQRITQWKQLEESSGTRHDPDTLKPVLGPDGKTPLLTEGAQSKKDAQASQEARDAETKRANQARESGDKDQLDATLRGQALTSATAAGEAAQKGAEEKLKRTVGPGYAPALQELLRAGSSMRRADPAKLSGPMTFNVAPQDDPAAVGARTRDELYKKLAPFSPAARAEMLNQQGQQQATPPVAAAPPTPPGPMQVGAPQQMPVVPNSAAANAGLILGNYPPAYQNIVVPPEEEEPQALRYPSVYATA